MSFAILIKDSRNLEPEITQIYLSFYFAFKKLI